ncbi:MAG: sensor histidine kinase [Candidatus Humimicrobiaceae bacterium]
MKSNKEKLNRMISNLLKNSIDYKMKGGSIIFTIKNIIHNIFLKITDTSIGINKEDLKHVFKRFYKAIKSGNISENSAATSLSIIREIANIHKIHINIKSDIDKGTTVILTFKKAA